MQLEMFERQMPCARCGFPCRPSSPVHPDARLLQRAQDGVCPSCATTQFLMSIETVMYGIEKNGVGMLLRQDVQKQFASVMQAGNADVSPEEIDWQWVIAQWDLPFPNKRR